MRKYNGVIFATIFSTVAIIIFLLIGGKLVFVAGTTLSTSGILLALYWLEVIFRGENQQKNDPVEYRRIHYPVLIIGFALGGMDYLTLKLIFGKVSGFLAAILILLPPFVSGYIVRMIYIITPEDNLQNILTPWKEFLLTFFVNMGIWSIIAGLKLVSFYGP